MTEISSQNVIVTGANRGIGKAISRQFAEKGATVGLLGRRRDAVEETIEELQAETGNETLSPIVADVSDFEKTDEAVGNWIEEQDGVDTLVNNAGINRDGLMMRMKEDDWNDVLDINLDGTFNCSKAVIRNMIRNRWGRIIMISSVAGLRGNPGQANYSASKSGMIGLCKSIARELGSRNITANTVAPGYIETDMTEELPEDQKEGILEATPLERFGEPEEIADCVTFLASEKADFITGEVVRVDGGMAM
ncbi:MAG: 3-oxoacyl-[acyl-carrier-protein] reductase [bacterium]